MVVPGRMGRGADCVHERGWHGERHRRQRHPSRPQTHSLSVWSLSHESLTQRDRRGAERRGELLAHASAGPGHGQHAPGLPVVARHLGGGRPADWGMTARGSRSSCPRMLRSPRPAGAGRGDRGRRAPQRCRLQPARLPLHDPPVAGGGLRGRTAAGLRARGRDDGGSAHVGWPPGGRDRPAHYQRLRARARRDHRPRPRAPGPRGLMRELRRR